MWPIRSSRSAVAFARLALAVLAIVVAGGGAVAPVLLNRQGRPPAATGGEAAGVTVGEPRDDRVVITRESRDGGALPAGCGPREVAHLIARFFDAFNRGDQDALAAVVFRSPLPGVGPSQWYSVAEAGAPPFAAYDLDAFLAYAAERHRRHERLRLVAVSVSGPGWHGGAGVVYALTRHADERPRWPSWPGGGGRRPGADGGRQGRHRLRESVDPGVEHDRHGRAVACRQAGPLPRAAAWHTARGDPRVRRAGRVSSWRRIPRGSRVCPAPRLRTSSARWG